MDIKQLQNRCEMPWEEFEGEVWETKNPYHHYRFIDNGKNVLAVAHLDYVGTNKTFGAMWHNGRQKAFHGGMDDRAGAYIILDLLPSLLGNMPYDVLLTDEEEHGQSSASIFAEPRKYNWIFEFDREGLDAVMYDYGSDEWDKILESYGWKAYRGSSTDICKLYRLGCRGFNFGNGNHDGHGQWNHVDLLEMQTSAQWFVKFWKDYHLKGLPFNEKTDRRKTTYSQGQWSGWGDGEYMGQSWEKVPTGVVGDDGPVYEWQKKKKKKHGLLIEPCEDCGETRELDPSSYLCSRCTKSWAKAGVFRPSNYKFKVTYVSDKEDENEDKKSDDAPAGV